MWIGLTGSPRINGVLYADQAVVSGRGVDESQYFEARGIETLLDERIRPTGTIVWRSLDEATASALQSDLGLRFVLDVRVERADDPAWASELSLEVRRTSDVELTTPTSPYDSATGRPVVIVTADWRCVRTYTLAELGLGPVGGYRLVSDDGDTIVIEPQGRATHQSETYDVSYRSAVGRRGVLTLGPDPASATRITPASAGTAIIQTTQ